MKANVITNLGEITHLKIHTRDGGREVIIDTVLAGILDIGSWAYDSTRKAVYCETDNKKYSLHLEVARKMVPNRIIYKAKLRDEIAYPIDMRTTNVIPIYVA